MTHVGKTVGSVKFYETDALKRESNKTNLKQNSKNTKLSYSPEPYGKMIFPISMAKEMRKKHDSELNQALKIKAELDAIEKKVENLTENPDIPIQIKKYIEKCLNTMHSDYLPSLKPLAEPELYGFKTPMESNKTYVEFCENHNVNLKSDTVFVPNIPHVKSKDELFVSSDLQKTKLDHFLELHIDATQKMKKALTFSETSAMEEVGLTEGEFRFYVYWFHHVNEIMDLEDSKYDALAKDDTTAFNVDASIFDHIKSYRTDFISKALKQGAHAISCYLTSATKSLHSIFEFYHQVHNHYHNLSTKNGIWGDNVARRTILYITTMYNMWVKKLELKFASSGGSALPRVVTDKNGEITIEFNDTLNPREKKTMEEYVLRLVARGFGSFAALYAYGYLRLEWFTLSKNSKDQTWLDYVGFSSGLKQVHEDLNFAQKHMESYINQTKQNLYNEPGDPLKLQAAIELDQYQQRINQTLQYCKDKNLSCITSFKAEAETEMGDVVSKVDELLVTQGHNRLTANMVLCATKFNNVKRYMLNRTEFEELFKDKPKFLEEMSNGTIFSRNPTARSEFLELCTPLIIKDDLFEFQGNYTIFNKAGRMWINNTLTNSTKLQPKIQKEFFEEIYANSTDFIRVNEFTNSAKNFETYSDMFKNNIVMGRFNVSKNLANDIQKSYTVMIEKSSKFFKKVLDGVDILKIDISNQKALNDLNALIAEDGMVDTINTMSFNCREFIRRIQESIDEKDLTPEITQYLNNMTAVLDQHENVVKSFRNVVETYSPNLYIAKKENVDLISAHLKDLAAYYKRAAIFRKYIQVEEIADDYYNQNGGKIGKTIAKTCGLEFIYNMTQSYAEDKWHSNLLAKSGILDMLYKTEKNPVLINRDFWNWMVSSSYNFDLERLNNTCYEMIANSYDHLQCTAMLSSSVLDRSKISFLWSANHARGIVLKSFLTTIISIPWMVLSEGVLEIRKIIQRLSETNREINIKNTMKTFEERNNGRFQGHIERNTTSPIQSDGGQKICNATVGLINNSESKKPSTFMYDFFVSAMKEFSLGTISFIPYIFEVSSIYTSFSMISGVGFYLISFIPSNIATFLAIIAAVGGAIGVVTCMFNKKGDNSGNNFGGFAWGSLWTSLIAGEYLLGGVLNFNTIWKMSGITLYQILYMTSFFAVGTTDTKQSFADAIDCFIAQCLLVAVPLVFLPTLYHNIPGLFVNWMDTLISLTTIIFMAGYVVESIVVSHELAKRIKNFFNIVSDQN